MRRNFGIIITIILVVAVIIALGVAGNTQFDRPPENEQTPNRSSYNAGPTGTRAFYQLLEESGVSVARLRDDFKALNRSAKNGTIVIIGPFQLNFTLSADEARQLKRWVAKGGRVLVVSRFPRAQFGDPVIHSQYKEKLPSWDMPAEQVEGIIDGKSDELIAQPTALTYNLRGLALSEFATRMKFYAEIPKEESDKTGTPAPKPTVTPQLENEEETPEPTKSPTPTASPGASPSPSPEISLGEIFEDENEENDDSEPLYAPVVHLGDQNGAVLADFKYGEGRVILLSDPFVIANNGIAHGANLQLAMNLVHSIGEGGRRFYFDEYHHGYRDASNPLFQYFRGTPMLWLIVQGLLLAGMLIWTYGRRFARPLPLPQVDRHSPLEFVGSMAQLQQAAEARDLALENIYPRFKAQLCRRLGISSKAQIEEIVECAQRRHAPVSAEELRHALQVSEVVLRGGRAAESFDDAQMMKAVTTMRRVIARMAR